MKPVQGTRQVALRDGGQARAKGLLLASPTATRHRRTHPFIALNRPTSAVTNGAVLVRPIGLDHRSIVARVAARGGAPEGATIAC